MTAEIRYRCDVCDVPLPTGYVPQVDHRGRPVLAICARCNDEDVRARAKRLGLTSERVVDFPDSYVDSPTDGYAMPRYQR